MPKPTFRRPFLKRLFPLWAERLPEWTAGTREPVRWAEADSSLHRVVEHTGRALIVHLWVFFTPNWPGAFTADIVVSAAAEPLPLQPPTRWSSDVAALSLGRYRVGFFGRRKDYWWHLKDEGATSFGSRTRPTSDHWYAASYADFGSVLGEALEDFTVCLEREVIPKLARVA